MVLYFGRISRKKGLDLLTKAFAELPADAHLAIVGPDDRDGSIAQLEGLRRAMKLEGRMHIAGARFGRGRLEAFVDADVFVLPSINENFGNVAAESIACGVPAIVSDQCGIAPILGDRAGRVVPYDQAALTRAMQTLLFDRDARARAVSACAAVAAELSWDERITEMEALYARVARRS